MGQDAEIRRREGRLKVGQNIKYQTTESPHQSPVKKTQCMVRDKPTPGARDEDHFLSEVFFFCGVGTYQNQSGMHHASVSSKERQNRRSRRDRKSTRQKCQRQLVVESCDVG